MQACDRAKEKMKNAIQNPGKKEIRNFKIFTVLFWFSNYIVTPYITPQLQAMGVSNIIIGYVVSSYSIAQILIRVPLGVFSDRIGKRKLFIIIGSALTLISVSGLWLTKSVGWFFFFRTLQGLAVTSWVCATVLYASYLRPDEAVHATVQLQVCNSGGTLAGYILGGIIAGKHGYQSVFLAAAVGALLAAVASTRIVEIQKETNQFRIGMLLRVGCSPFLLYVAGMAVFGQILLSSTIWGFTPQLATELGGGATGVAISSMCFSVAGLLCALFVTVPVRKALGERCTLVAAMALEAVFCILQSRCSTLTSLYICCFCTGITHNMSYSMLLGMSIELFPEKVRAAAMGWHQAIYALGLFIGPVVAGYFSELYGLKVAFGVVGAIGLFGAVLALLLYNKTRYKTRHQHWN